MAHSITVATEPGNVLSRIMENLSHSDRWFLFAESEYRRGCPGIKSTARLQLLTK
jgi:hypothetical protein